MKGRTTEKLYSPVAEILEKSLFVNDGQRRMDISEVEI